MHGFTPISIAGALTSLIVSPLLIWIVIRAKREAVFLRTPFVGLLLFETLFLVGYMTFLSFQPARSGVQPDPWDAVLGAVHGVAALFVFVGFWALLPIAQRAYRRGNNLFASRPALTWSAIVARCLALGSGEAIFVLHMVR